ncbi:DUF2868 domain-containing protein [Nitrincola alkalilacustris]|uniref:DUF2868 domain-containing protein n=1 Tax=Nitrincola alkalilacustris TaxID=1571224 RepID=UPI00124D03F2|nr:DUF2868 domain-containing protein [Nitrincola alkalilacustris]
MTFRDRQIAELVKARYNNGLIDIFTAISSENSKLIDTPSESPEAKSSKEARIIKACNRFHDDSSEEIINSTTRKISVLSTLFLVLMFSLGTLAALQSFAQPSISGVNVFWLLLLLLGPNLLMLIIWVAMMLFNHNPSSSSSLTSLPGYIIRQFVAAIYGTKNDQKALQINILKTLYKPLHGRWLFSLISHLGWAGFMLGGLACVLLILLARQVNFVWETTLLDADAFTHLTLMLSYLPSLTGLDMPNATTVAQSRLGAPEGQLADVRTQWATFLILCIVVYGLLPRLLLAGVSYHLYRSRREAFRLDLSEPFYQQLIRHLDPPSRQAGILDPDALPPTSPSSDLVGPLAAQGPEAADWIGFELDNSSDWPPVAIKQGKVLHLVNDRQTQQQLFDLLKSYEGHALVIATSLLRTPDRGIERFLRQIQKSSSQTVVWIGLSASSADMANHPERLDDWIQLSARCHIPSHQIFVIDKDQNR